MVLLQASNALPSIGSPLFPTALAFLFIIVVLRRALRDLPLYRIPLVGQNIGSLEERRQAYLHSARKLYCQGYREFKNGIFRITTSRKTPTVVLSPRFLSELKTLPDTTISMTAAVEETMDCKYTKIQPDVPVIPATIKARLTPALPQLSAAMSDEVRAALTLALPDSSHWTEIDMHKTLTRVVAMVSGRVFVGPELCRTEEYVDSAINYTMDVMAAQRAVHEMRPVLRPFLASRLSQVKRLQNRIKEADAFLQPLVDVRREAAKNPNYAKPDDMLQWIVDAHGGLQNQEGSDLAKIQLGLSFAAIHTTTLVAMNAFYDLAALPELADELRHEARTALDDSGGLLTSSALQGMRKLDSLLKETMRFHPASMTSFQRKVPKTFTLSNGQVIPAGVLIEVPAIAVSFDSDKLEGSNRFDALRYYRSRQKFKKEGSAGKAAMNQFVSVSQDSLTFGYGRHACPGRFFAAQEIKMIVLHALTCYDFKLAEGFKRYTNVEFAHMSIPDASKKLLCRKREA